MISILYNIIWKCLITKQYHSTPTLWVPCCYVLYFFKYAFFTNQSQNCHNKDPKIFGWNCCIHPCMPNAHVRAVQNDISTKIVPIWLHRTVLKFNASDLDNFTVETISSVPRLSCIHLQISDWIYLKYPPLCALYVKAIGT